MSSFGQIYAENKKRICGGSFAIRYEEYRHQRGRLLREMIDKGFIGMTLDKAGVVKQLPEKSYSSGGLDTVSGFYEVLQLGPDYFRQRLATLYETDDVGLEKIVEKVEELLGPRIVGRYKELRKYIKAEN